MNKQVQRNMTNIVFSLPNWGIYQNAPRHKQQLFIITFILPQFQLLNDTVRATCRFKIRERYIIPKINISLQKKFDFPYLKPLSMIMRLHSSHLYKKLK